ncbi:MAG: DUF494 family protein [Gammaproteobacteria bacterium]|nr:DUF494 family protein [Gammaproteobacteria bacterium]
MKKELNLREHMLGVIMYLFEHHLDDKVVTVINRQQLISELRNAGFEEAAIHDGLEWLSNFEDRIADRMRMHPEKDLSWRFYSEDESFYINEECQAFILRMEQLRIFTPVIREMLIDKIVRAKEKITIDKLHWLAVVYLFNNSYGDKEIFPKSDLFDNSQGKIQ